MNKLSLYILTSTFVLANCGGGGGDSKPTEIPPSFSYNVPTTITNANNPSSSGCTGTTWDDCIKLTATANDPQNRLLTKEWLVYNSNGSNCEPYTRNSDNIIYSPLYCGHSGYSCGYRYRWQYTHTPSEGSPFSRSEFQDFNVNINAIPCASGSAIDGYIQEAFVYADLNKNFMFDANEPNTTTSQLGQFTFDVPVGANELIIINGGIDSATGIEMPKNYTLLGLIESDKKFIVSPLSSIDYFLPDTFSIPDNLKLNSFDYLNDDPLIQLHSSEASKVLLTNIKISIITESISKALNIDDYTKIYESLANQIFYNNINLENINSKNLIFESLIELNVENNLDEIKILTIAETVTGFLDSITIKEDEVYLKKFEEGIKMLPINIENYVDNDIAIPEKYNFEDN